MNDMKEYKISRIIWLLCLALTMTGCSEDLASSFADDEIKPGDPIQFAPYVSGRATTRATDVSAFHATDESYLFTYEIYKTGPTLVGSGSELFWPDNTIAYGFKVTAGSNELATDQTTKVDFLLQDKLLGYAAIASTEDNIDRLNYRTCVNWKAANASAGVAAENQKTIPLYLKHQRSRITVILKAGDGVRPEELVPAATTTNIVPTIYSYIGEAKTSISPYASAIAIDYGGTIGTRNSTQYSAIVEPHNYSTQDIVTINLSGQSTTFNGSYDLSTAGKHLVLTLTLTRAETFKALVTARIVDWVDETPTTVTLDDFGQTN